MAFGFGMGFRFGSRQGGAVKTVEELFAERSVILDFENDTFFWDGEAKTIGDLTDTEQGYASGTVDWFGAAYTVVIDHTINQGASADECLLSIAGSPSTTRLFEIVQGDLSDRNTIFTQLNPVGFPLAPEYAAAASQGCKGRTRSSMAVAVGQVMAACVDNYRADPVSASALTAVAGTQCFIGYRHIVTPDQTFGGTINAIHIWPRKLSDAELRKVTRFGNGAELPVHIIGDSFANDNIISMFVREDLTGYTPLSNDSAGGQSLAQHATRFAATPWFYDSTLVILEGGLDFAGVDGVAAINDMIGRLSHDRFLICEPVRGTHLTPASADRIAHDALWAAIVSAFPDNIIPTFDALADAGDDSEDDNADIADGFCPRSLRIDGIHLTVEGAAIYAGQISAALIAKGWAYGGPIYEEAFGSDTSGDWSYGTHRVDGTKAVSGGALVYTRGAGDGAFPRIYLEVSGFAVGREYDITATLGGDSEVTRLFVSEDPTGDNALAQFNGGTDTLSFTAPASSLYLVMLAGLSGTDVSVDDILIE